MSDAEALFEEEDHDDDHVSDVDVEDEFESKSMFDMFFGKKNKNKGQDGSNQKASKGDNQK